MGIRTFGDPLTSDSLMFPTNFYEGLLRSQARFRKRALLIYILISGLFHYRSHLDTNNLSLLHN